jgi:multidrug efflux system membrane fusion protein
VQSLELAAVGKVKASEAAVKNAQLELDYTTITAPIDGRIGHALVNVGNLVSEEVTLLTTLVQLDPIYVYFSPSNAEYQEIQSYQAKGQLKFTMILAGGEAYPHQGELDFVDNQVDVKTGTIKMRAVFANPEKTERPGQYVKVQIRLGENSDAILVPAPAIGEDEAGHYLFVVAKDNKAERRRIKLGAAFQDQYVIEDGLEVGEKVIVKGLQKVHGGQVVNAQSADSNTSSQ